ncbi:microtubule-associated protein 70-5-like isoform X2 [Zingiber officinale]|uniref:microtubule-associated protein 70-5-like isoform X2 n=1 Tax=Zingiber officinale TaxID=94328 RepID=UPI001C4A979A|nr:microtubule-associated protein 70-5-like isoform X2 [Zingiber officinale]
MGSLGDAAGAKELFASLSDPVIIELNRLQNSILEKERELGLAKNEIKALKGTEILKDKAIMELSNQLKKMDEKLGITEKQLEQKNLDIKKLTNETKEALAAQISAEAILRRVYANQKDEELTPIEVLIAPLESDIKQYRNEIVMLQEDIKALERLTKSKEAALVEAESLLHNALEQVRNVEVMKNKNLELKRQIEICQEENKILEKTYRKKVVEVEKLMKTIHELEENILAGGASANAIRDYQRKISEINEEKRMVERELARVKVSAGRIATAAANEWKDDGDKVIPVKQWLEERRILQGEIQRLKDKLTLAGRTLKAETQLKEKLSLRLKTLEQCMKHSSLPEKTRDLCERKKCELASPKDLKKVSHAPNNDTVLQKPNLNSGDVDNARGMVSLNSNVVKKNSLALRSRSFNDTGKENAETNVRSNRYADDVMMGRNQVNHEVNEKKCGDSKSQNENQENGYEDMVSGFLYDKLQKKVINLKESHKDKDNVLIMKDEEIKFLLRKVDVLTKAVEVESKKKRRNAREKEMIKLENNKHNIDI